MEKKNSKGKTLVLMDIIFYAAVPFIIWKYGRDIFGDYAAMLISTVPGFIYTCYRFYVEKQFNIAGLFILGSLVVGTVVDLLSGGAEQMLWNGIYLSLVFVFIHFIALIIKRPLALYFAVDFVYLQGHARKDSTWLFYQEGIFKWFQFIQLGFIVRGLFLAGLNTLLLQKYGIDGYDKMLIYRQIAGWFFSILITGLFIYTNIPIKRFLDEQVENREGNEKATFSGDF
ncbi:VC0807 family protein [Virgibacillus halophilus]|uniref:VC0807 family protein n=1 Tax=Tigheibacillus halophilus TaxID=361280 RepID=A0ABU5CBD6_9BACI|nr:VC0807 family protein [Virgibacillus halophilus]